MTETDYVEWLRSIRFVNKEGQELPKPKSLPKDESDDPEDDREMDELAAQQ